VIERRRNLLSNTEQAGTGMLGKELRREFFHPGRAWHIPARCACQWTSAEPARPRPPASQLAIIARARSITQVRSSSAISHQYDSIGDPDRNAHALAMSVGVAFGLRTSRTA
jgi:hypothetical protein